LELEDVERALLRKLGASEERGQHHVFFFYRDGASNYEVAKLSHSWHRRLNDTQVGMLARKLFLQKREFEDFVECTLSADDMAARWRSRRPAY
jgi:hypothetical protein